MEEVTNLISNLGFPIFIVLGLGYGIYNLSMIYMKSSIEREVKLMNNNKETLELVQKIIITIEKINDKIDRALINNKDKGDNNNEYK